MKKTVLHILNTSSYSGAENVAITIIQNFQKKNSNYRFVYVSLDGSIRMVLENNGIEFEPIKKVCVKEIKRVIKKYKPSVIHAHDFTASIVSVFSTIKIPVISHIHNNSPWIKKINVKSIAYGVTCFRYKKIIGVSPSVFNEFIFGKCFRKKEMVAGNPIDTQKIRNQAKNAVVNRSYDVVFLGRLTEPKNPLLFVEIINDLNKNKSVSACMIGDGELRSSVEGKIAEYGLKNVVTLEGFIENPHGILNNSKILCLPSSWEGFGLVAVEALALSKPVVASPVGGIPTIIVGEEGCLCANKEEFVVALKNLLNDENEYQKASNKALIRANEMDNIETYVKALERIYSEE